MEDQPITGILNSDHLEQQTESIRREANLQVLRKADPNIIDVVKRASFVSVYVLNEVEQAWSRADIEGALHIVIRDEEPKYRLIILNQRNPQNLVEAITAAWEISAEDNYIFFRVPVDPTATQSSSDPSARRVAGLWFSDDRERREVQGTIENILDEFLPQRRPFKDSDEKGETISVGSITESGEGENGSSHEESASSNEIRNETKSGKSNSHKSVASHDNQVKDVEKSKVRQGASLATTKATSLNNSKTVNKKTASAGTTIMTAATTTTVTTTNWSKNSSNGNQLTSTPQTSKNTANPTLSPRAMILDLLGVVKQSSVAFDESSSCPATTTTPTVSKVLKAAEEKIEFRTINNVPPKQQQPDGPPAKLTQKIKIKNKTGQGKCTDNGTDQHQITANKEASCENPRSTGLLLDSSVPTADAQHVALQKESVAASRKELSKGFKEEKGRAAATAESKGLLLIPNVTRGVLYKKPQPTSSSATQQNIKSVAESLSFIKSAVVLSPSRVPTQEPMDNRKKQKTRKHLPSALPLHVTSENESAAVCGEPRMKSGSVKPEETFETAKQISGKSQESEGLTLHQAKRPKRESFPLASAGVEMLGSSSVNGVEECRTNSASGLLKGEAEENEVGRLEKLFEHNLKSTMEKPQQMVLNKQQRLRVTNGQRNNEQRRLESRKDEREDYDALKKLVRLRVLANDIQRDTALNSPTHDRLQLDHGLEDLNRSDPYTTESSRMMYSSIDQPLRRDRGFSELHPSQPSMRAFRPFNGGQSRGCPVSERTDSASVSDMVCGNTASRSCVSRGRSPRKQFRADRNPETMIERHRQRLMMAAARQRQHNLQIIDELSSYVDPHETVGMMSGTDIGVSGRRDAPMDRDLYEHRLETYSTGDYTERVSENGEVFRYRLPPTSTASYLSRDKAMLSSYFRSQNNPSQLMNSRFNRLSDQSSKDRLLDYRESSVSYPIDDDLDSALLVADRYDSIAGRGLHSSLSLNENQPQQYLTPEGRYDNLKSYNLTEYPLKLREEGRFMEIPQQHRFSHSLPRSSDGTMIQDRTCVPPLDYGFNMEKRGRVFSRTQLHLRAKRRGQGPYFE